MLNSDGQGREPSGVVRQLAAKDATIAYLRAELQRTARVLSQRQQAAAAQRQRDRAVAAAVTATATVTTERPLLTRDDPKRNFFRDRQSTGLRQELLHSGATIRQLRDSLARAQHAHEAALARERRSYDQSIAHVWRFEGQQRSRFFEFHGHEMQRQGDYYTATMDARTNELDRLRENISLGPGAVSSTPALTNTSTTDMNARVDAHTPEVAVSVRAMPSCVHPLTCAQVVGKVRLACGLDVLPLISSFLLTTDLPIDLVVSRGSLHIAGWLFANGRQPTARTAHVAVNTGCLSMVQLVFHHFPETDLGAAVFRELPIGSHAAIAEWLTRQYPAPMATEFARLATSQTQFQHNQWAWYADHLKSQWEWEGTIDDACWQRKRARLRGHGQ